MERLETTAAGRQSDTEAELADIGTGIDDIKKQVTAFEEQHNRSLVRDKNTLIPFSYALGKVTTKVYSIKE
jgi:hypothetical protein